MRVALCVGCNEYDNIGKLTGAEVDARRMFGLLLDTSLGNYDINHSKLLLSPSLSDVRSALDELLYDGEPPTDFTFFFAGHGGVAHDTLYLALRDSDVRKLAISGLSFGELVKIVVAARPSQANFILDACNTGGLGVDLQGILRQSLTGTADSTGVSAIAAAASDEGAAEAAEGGAFTSALTDLIAGQTVVQTHKPFLDLTELGAALRLRPTDRPQTPSAWVLNLQGPNRFSQNPHFKMSGSDEIIAAIGRRLVISEQDLRALKRCMLHLNEDLDERVIAKVLEGIVKKLGADDAATLLSGISEGVAEAVRLSADPFSEGRVLGVFVGQLLGLCSGSALARQYVATLLARIQSADLRALLLVKQKVDEHRYSLMGKTGLADLFFLPLRITDILGRLGALLLSDDLGEAEAEALRALAAKLLSIYGNSLVALCDEQAAPICVFLAACRKRCWSDEAEEVVGRLYNDLTLAAGRVGAHFLSGKRALILLRQRHNPMSPYDSEIYQSPSDLTTVVLFAAGLLRLDEAVDTTLVLLDHTALNFFCPDESYSIGRVGPIPGRNKSLSVGRGIWRCIDARREWYGGIRDFLLEAKPRLEKNLSLAGTYAALSMRDRVPWDSFVDGFAVPDGQVFMNFSVEDRNGSSS